MADDRLENYVEVSERIRRFYKEYPDGRLVTDSYEFVYLEHLPDQAKIGSKEKEIVKNYLVVKALAYRTPDDPYPAVGLAQERIPGKTPYTHEAEIQNGETSAIGRAIAMTGLLEPGESIASANEVRNRQETTDERPATDKQKQWLGPEGSKRRQHSVDDETYEKMLGMIGIKSINELKFHQVEPLIALIQTGEVPGEYTSDVPADMEGLESSTPGHEEKDLPWAGSNGENDKNVQAK